MTVHDALVAPFLEFASMRRALGCGPVGVPLVLRRMSLVGDAMSHAALPGAAIGFLAAGLSLWAMSAGGFLEGLTVAVPAGLVQAAPDRAERLREGHAAYKAELDALDREIKAALAPIPKGDRRIVTSHDAFGYYARSFGVTFLAPSPG